MITIAGLVLASAFISNVKHALLHGVLGPIPGGTVVKKQSLIAGEILLGVLLVVWILAKTVKFSRYGPTYEMAGGFPNGWPVVAIAFWDHSRA